MPPYRRELWLDIQHAPFQQQYSSCVGSGIAPAWQLRVECEEEPCGQSCHPASRPQPSQKHVFDIVVALFHGSRVTGAMRLRRRRVRPHAGERAALNLLR